jgi:type II secretory pathway component PulF
MAATPPPLPPPAPLDYRVPSPRAPQGFSAAAVTWAVFQYTLTAGVFVWILGYVVPRLVEVFRDFKLELTFSTRLLLDVSRWVTDSYGWAILFPAAAVAGLLAGFWQSNAPPASRRAYRLLVVLFLAAVIAWMAFALFVPLAQLYGGLR